MKRSVREKNSIIVYFIIYVFFTIGLIVFIFYTIVPGIKEIEEKKEDTKNIYSDIERIIKSGLTLVEFKQNLVSSKDYQSINNILKSTTEDFYNNNLINNEYKTYKEFISKKIKELNSNEYKDTTNKQERIVYKILPPYSESGITLGKETLTDYKFINYIESIIDTFNLESEDQIGIRNIKLLEDYKTSGKNDNLTSNIYSIPLSMVLLGSKSGIIDFLYFIENVGNIELKGEKIIVNENDFYFSKNSTKKILKGDKYIPNEYNIFENQIIDISKITMDSYFDTVYTSFRGTEDFKKYINKTQGNQVFQINIELEFYIRGQPTYKIKKLITSTIDKHKKARILINSLLKDKKINNISRNRYVKENNIINELNKRIAKLNSDMNKGEDLDNIYKESLVLNKLIDPILQNFKYIDLVLSNKEKVTNKATSKLENNNTSVLLKEKIQEKINKLNFLEKEVKNIKENIIKKNKVNAGYKRIIEIDLLIDEISISLQ